VAQQRQAREAAEAAGAVAGVVAGAGERAGPARERLELDHGHTDRDFSVAELELDDQLDLKADG